MKKYYFIFCLLLCAFITSAENTPSPYSWEAKPSYINIPEKYTTEDRVGLYSFERYEYYHNEEGNLMVFQTIHKKYRALNDKAVNELNTLSIEIGDGVELIDIRARTINEKGEVVQFDKSNIKEVTDDESRDKYKIFAIDGIEIGSDIEYVMVKNIPSDYFGRSYFQYPYPLLEAKWEMSSPATLIFDTKAYNGEINLSQKSIEERNFYAGEMKNIPALKEEKYAFTNPRRARIEFRLAMNKGRGNFPIFTWDHVAQRIYNNNYLLEDNELDALTEVSQEIDLNSNDLLQRISNIENYIKKNILIQEFHVPDFYNLDFVVKNKVSSEKGIVKLYANLFKKLGVKHNVVLSSERDLFQLDKDFSSWDYLQKYLIYLPQIDKYIAPANMEYRLGCFPPLLASADGLFVELVRVGEFESAIGHVKRIKELDYHENYDHMFIKLDLDVEESQTHIITERCFHGLSGGFLKQYYDMMDEKAKTEFLKELMTTKLGKPEYNEITTKEQSNKKGGENADFIIYSDVISTDFMEQAGNKILIQIGESIGPQAEMYQKEERKADIENEFNRWYVRTINFMIPEGYRISNPEVADMNVIHEIDGETKFKFVSNHRIEGDQYIVEIDEFYNEIYTDKAYFEAFRKVVNAAADFNKAVLILEEI
jgi:hypothetical protein